MSFIDCVVSNVAIATVLALVAAVVGRVTTKPQVTHTLWLLVLVKLVTPPVVYIPMSYTISGPVALDSSVNSVTAMSEPLSSMRGESTGNDTEYGTGNAPLVVSIPTVSFEEADTSSSIGSAPVVPWMDVLAGVWVTGSVVWFLLAATRLMRFRKVLRYAHPASADILAEVSLIASSYVLSRLPRVLVVDAKVPPLIGVFGRRATMVLPGGLLSKLGEDERAGLLAHELAHLKRYDHWIRWFEFAVLGIYWWNPVAWWARSQVQQAEEECCDGWVIWAFPGNAPLYAQTLVDTVDFLARSPESKPVMATAFSQGNSLKRRIEMIVNNQGGRRLSWRMRGMLVMLSLAIIPMSFARSGENNENAGRRNGKAISNKEDRPLPTSVSDEDNTDNPLNREMRFRSLLLHSGEQIDDPTLLSETRSFRVALHGPRITDDELKRLANRTDLEGLAFLNTSVTGTGLRHLRNLDNLETLVLFGTHVTDTWLANLPTLKGLKRIVFTDTSVTNAGFQHLQKLTQLRKLELRYSSIDDEGLKVLEHLPNLTALYLRGTDVGDRGLTNLRYIPKLTRLELTHTKVSDEGLANLRHVPKLRYFSLASPNVKGIGTANLKHTQLLQELQFVGGNVTDEWMRSLPPLTEVDWLELNDTKVTSAGLKAVANWAKLRNLYLNRNRSIDDQVVAHLKGLDGLKILELQGTQVTTEGAGQLRAILPNAIVRVTAENP